MLQLQHVRSEDALNGHNQMHAAAPRLFGKSVALIAASELNNPLLFASSFLSAASPGRLDFFYLAEIKYPFKAGGRCDGR